MQNKICQPWPCSKCMVLGLDGVPLNLARLLAERGLIPHLAKILPGAGSLTADLPDVSPVNWTSFFTATGPEEHGIFGFTRVNSGDYSLGLCDFSHVAAPTIFDRLGQAGYYSRVINLPNTWPARPLKGMMISGFVAQDFPNAIYPPFLRGVMAGYKLEADTARAARDPAFLFAELEACLESRRRAFRLLWPDQAWDLLVLTLTETDRLFHFLWSAVVDQNHPLHPDAAAFFRNWDGLAGEVINTAESLGARLIILADHGFTGLITEVDINTWLRENGYLIQTIPPDVAPELDGACIAPESSAFALDPGRIYINAASRFASGKVDEDRVGALREEIREGLLNLEYEGNRIFAEIKRGAELYNGPLGRYAPDLVCVAEPGFDLKAKFNRNAVFGFFGRDGTHTPQGALFYDSLGEEAASPREVGRLVLRHFNMRRQPG